MSNDLIRHSTERSVHIVELCLPDGMDSSDIDRLNEGLNELFAVDRPNTRWILDLAEVAYMGSSALGLMVNIRHKIKTQGGRLALCNMNPQLLQVFKACCLERLFTISKTREDAHRTLK